MQRFITPVRLVRMRRGAIATVLALIVTASSLVAAGWSSVAGADTAPPAGTPATVSNDSLPTWQINGVVWSQVVVGNTVYVTGNFSSARPPGARSGTGEVARGNLLAYDIRTGSLITSFNHSLNAQGRGITASPDGARVYVGGEFTQVDGQTHNRVAAFSTSTGALLTSFLGSVDATVYALTASNSVVYVGGAFSSAGNQGRSRLAAFDGLSGAVTSWNPGANATVNALTVSPDKSKVVAGGHFTTLGGQPRYGLGAVDQAAGAATPWTSNPVIKDAGPDAAILSLSSDSLNIYGSGYVYGSGGNVEGNFAINATGDVVFLNDCHGDTYSAWPIGQSLYTVGHNHYCGNLGAFGEDTQHVGHHALAFTTYRTGTLRTNPPGSYANFGGQPCGTLLDWNPDVTPGTFTGQSQAAWSVSGNADYVVLGGEFPRVNGVAQQGLARFARAGLAPNKMGPLAATALTPVASLSGTAIRLSWATTWDTDNGVLTYRVYRDAGTNPIGSTTADTRFYTVPKPAQTFTDNSPPNGAHTYRIVVSDPFGNTVSGSASNAVTTSGGNAAPTASFTATCTQLSCNFNGTASGDPDGSISGYAWNFGDGGTGSGSTIAHTYPAAGSYSATLTVTDNSGATAQQVKTVTVNSVVTPPSVFASDGFNRTVSGGLGTADAGGAWSATAAGPSQSVTPGTARFAFAGGGSNISAALLTTSETSSIVTTSASLNAVPNGTGAFLTVVGRRIDSIHEYRATLRVLADGGLRLSMTKLDGSSADVALGNQIALAGTYTPGQVLRLKFSVVSSAGSTTVAAKAWPDGTSEPAGYQVSAADTSAAMQAAGSVGLRAYLSSTTTTAGVVASFGPLLASRT
jgi:PKD repeat protein